MEEDNVEWGLSDGTMVLNGKLTEVGGGGGGGGPTNLD